MTLADIFVMQAKTDVFIASGNSDYKEAVDVINGVPDSEFDHILELALQLASAQIAVLTFNGSHRKFTS